jgi:hypothetical protein
MRMERLSSPLCRFEIRDANSDQLFAGFNTSLTCATSALIPVYLENAARIATPSGPTLTGWDFL